MNKGKRYSMHFWYAEAVKYFIYMLFQKDLLLKHAFRYESQKRSPAI